MRLSDGHLAQIPHGAVQRRPCGQPFGRHTPLNIGYMILMIEIQNYQISNHFEQIGMNMKMEHGNI